jgi:hypothetical protein
MNLEELRKLAICASEYEWLGKKVWLKKLSGKDHQELFCRVQDEEAKERTPAQDNAAAQALNIDIIARSLCSDAAGTLAITTPDVREFFANEVGFTDVSALADMVLSHSGYSVGSAEKKRDSETLTPSPSSSA